MAEASMASSSLLPLPDHHRQVVAEFLAAGVRFLVIGGRAVVFHGHTRLTHDLDLWLCPTKENVDQLAKAMGPLGYVLIPDIRERLSRPGAQLLLQPWETDLLTSLAGLEFEDVFKVLSHWLTSTGPIR
jgi:hypothetical protein